MIRRPDRTPVQKRKSVNIPLVSESTGSLTQHHCFRATIGVPEPRIEVDGPVVLHISRLT